MSHIFVMVRNSTRESPVQLPAEISNLDLDSLAKATDLCYNHVWPLVLNRNQYGWKPTIFEQAGGASLNEWEAKDKAFSQAVRVEHSFLGIYHSQ